ncbi:MAG TPA: glycosyl hydrolase 115 family protein, partial [Puia sp.]
DQRKILENVTGKPASETPQLWALYKEVQDYYDKGMRVPDDVTLLLCDDNWGNIRRLPKLTDKPRTGGYGIYYHFDYVGDPRNYKWINTNNIARVWEQMHLAYEHDAKNIWIVNVGDLKPMEFPITFFLQYAWNPGKWDAENLNDFYIQWSSSQFGKKYSHEIGNILKKYAQYASRKKPELLNADTYSLENFNEAQKVTDDWNSLLASAAKIYSYLPEEYKNAFFQLVLHPVKAYANLQNLYTAVSWNNLYAKENNPLANKYAADAKQFYLNDSLISNEYNALNQGKWNHMMDQTHIGYTNWQQPAQQTMPQLRSVDEVHETVSKATPINNTMDGQEFVERSIPERLHRNIFYERMGYVSIEAAHYTRKHETGQIHWKIIPGIGRDGDGIASFPVTQPQLTLASELSPTLEYEFESYDSGSFSLHTFFSPTLNVFDDPEGLQYAIALDHQKPKMISINKDDHDQKQWSQWVADNVIIKSTLLRIEKSGKHTITFYRISPAVVLQKIVLDFGGMKNSYLGPPETILKHINK